MKLTLEYICITQLQISGERMVFNTVTNIYQRDTSQLQIIFNINSLKSNQASCNTSPQIVYPIIVKLKLGGRAISF